MRKTYQGEITKEIVEKARLELLLHYKTTPLEVQEKYTIRSSGTANSTTGKTKWKRHCDICATANPSVAHTHDTKYHREKGSKSSSYQGLDKDNKTSSAYFDTGADRHYIKDLPSNYSFGDFGSVETAGGNGINYWRRNCTIRRFKLEITESHQSLSRIY